MQKEVSWCKSRTTHITGPPPIGLTFARDADGGSAVSRLGSLGFRLRFVFPVGHPFPLVVSQYFNPGQLNLQPLVDPDVPLSSIRLPDLTFTMVFQADRICGDCHPTLACADATEQFASVLSVPCRDAIQPIWHRGSVTEYGRCPVWIA